MAKISREKIEAERRRRRRKENKLIQKYLDESGIQTTVDRLNEYDRMMLLDRLRDV
jgi:hypothetical protein